MTDISNSHLLATEDSPVKVELAETELERRLSLYQVFLRLYEQHTGLLDEILQLENLYQPSSPGLKLYYIQGVVDGSVVYLMTNLCEDQTQTLHQPQHIWTIGRDRSNGIHISNNTYLSRYHAAIQYINHQGFFLRDFNSTNGSYVNGEPVHSSRILHDGDQIRLGNLTFSFFINLTNRVLPTVALELLTQLELSKQQKPEAVCYPLKDKKAQANQDSTYKSYGESFGGDNEPSREAMTKLQAAITHQKSEILERFFQRQTTQPLL